MTKEQKLIALAKLDGNNICYNRFMDCWETPQVNGISTFREEPSYLTNGDEIRRLIRKQPGNVIRSIERGLNKDTEKVLYPFLATTEQLAKLLLRATGNWVE